MKEEDVKTLVEEYQCPGCGNGPYPKCFEKGIGEGCKNHCVGTSLGLDMKFALGLPKGFCRSYQKSKDFVFIFESLEQKMNILVNMINLM